MQKIWCVLQKEFKQIFRDKQMVMIIFLLPLIQLMVIGFAISGEVQQVKLAILDQDHSALSRRIGEKFRCSDVFSVSSHTLSLEKAQQEIQRGNLQALLVIPHDFSKQMVREQQPQLGLFLDGLDGTVAGIAGAYAQQILQQTAAQLNSQKAPLQLETRMWFNTDLKTAQYTIPGLVAVLMTVISMMLASMSLVREKEIGTLEQLMVTPLKKHELLLGKLLPFLVLSLISMTVMMRAAQWIFGLYMMGSYGVLLVAAIAFLAVTLSFGTLVSTLAQTQQQAMFISWFFMVFMILLSGIFVSSDNMPPSMQLVCKLNPMHFFVNMLRDIFQKGSGFWALRKDFVGLLSLASVSFLLSYVKFSKRLQ